MQQLSPTRFTTQIEKLPEADPQHRQLFRYAVCDATGEIVFCGHAGDLSEASDTAQAYINYLLQDAALA
jgi:hypothetical protein